MNPLQTPIQRRMVNDDVRVHIQKAWKSVLVARPTILMSHMTHPTETL